MNIHELKIFPHYYKSVVDGTKPFELRKNDRDYNVGDILILKEYNQGFYDCTGAEKVCIQEKGYTGKEIKKTITYILEGGNFGLHKNYCILGLGEYVEMGNITDAEIDEFGKFSDYEKKIIKDQYSKYKKGFFRNPRSALY